MLKRIKFFFLAITILYSACSLPKKLKQLNINAQHFYEVADYGKALAAYDSIIHINEAKKKEANGMVYHNAGIAAWEVQELQKTLDYLEKAKTKGAVSDKLFFVIAKAYLKADNLSREIQNLDEYLNRYPNGSDIDAVKRQQFAAMVKSENWSLAFDLWPQLKPEYQKEAKLLAGFLQVNQNMRKEDQLKPLALELLSIDGDNLLALDVLAYHYYSLAEDRYQLEMQAYEKNRTNAQYKKLLAALEVVNSNFKVARDYYERLYKLDPQPKYATFLGNIYTRFDNKQKADYYYRKAKGK